MLVRRFWYRRRMQLLATYPFFIPLVVLVASEVTKVFLESWRQGSPALHHFFHPGGFPSTHSAFVTSLLIVVGRRANLSSLEFAIAFTFACIVWYDAMSSRREIGEQARALNRLQHWQHFTEQVGHSFREVLGGIAFGAVVTWVGILIST